MIVRQNEPASPGFGRYLCRYRAHTRRQNRRHETGAFAIYQLCFTNRFTGDERRTGYRLCQVFQSVGAICTPDEISGRDVGWPSQPLHVAGRNPLAEPDVVFGDENIYRGDLVALDLWRPLGTASQQSSNATGCDRDGQYYNARAFHTVTLT